MEKFSPSLWFRCALAALLLSSFSLAASAQSARFDLTGPKIDARVTRDGKTLPIAYVPNLQPGDKLWLHPDLPPTQSVHLLLIVAFLRGTTNPPPDEWFTKIETWNRKTNEGVTVTVPDEAQQAILFLAPETGGDFATLKKAVRGQPGIFVRASQDLLEAGFEQARIEKYIASMRQAPASDPKALLDHSNLLARTLNLKPNDDCFKRPVDMQYNCLTQSGNQTLLDDGHAQSVISVLSNGSSSDFITAASYTGVAGGGTYSAYVGAVVDLFRILGNLHTAQFQYIPAISFPEEESLNLRLNAAPSFRNPKSVIVIGLPSIQKSVPPPLRATDPKSIACLLKPKVVLPIEGAPLVFSTSFAHNLVLHLNVSQSAGEQPTSADIPLIPDAYQGGLIVDHAPGHRALPMPTEAELADPATHPAQADPKASTGQPATPSPSGEITGTITGSWGFDTFTGPTLHLQDILGANWKLAADDPLIAGRENHILLSSTGTACIASITAEATPGTFAPAVWKPANLPDLIDVNLPLKSHDPGALHISIQQFGENTPATVTARTFSEPATLTALEFHAGDTSITATGTNLSQVRQLTVDNLTFTPAPAPVPTATNQPTSNPANRETTLRVTLPDSTPAPKFKAGEKLNATVTLDDGRNITLPVTVAVSRPNLTLLSRNMGHPADPTLQLGSDEDLPISQQLTFSLKSPAPFPRNAKIEIANTDETLRTELTVAAGTLVLQNPHTILGTLDPLKTFGTSAFGPLRLRAVSPEGIPGDWIPLTTLVRLPTLDGITCPADPSALCTLSGANLYLLEAISTNPGFTTPITIPDGFVASTISIPRPTDLPATRTKSRTTTTTTTLYLRLRDDPTTTNSAIVQILPLPAKESPIPAPASITPPSVQPNAATSPSPTPTTAAPQTTPIQPAPTSAAP